MQYWYSTSHIFSKVSAVSTLPRFHPVQSVPAVSTLSKSPPLLPFGSPPHQPQATYCHCDGSAYGFPNPTASLLDCRLNQSLPHVSSPLATDNSAIQLVSHRRITPIKASSPSFITHISTANHQQSCSKHLVCHPRCSSYIGRHSSLLSSHAQFSFTCQLSLGSYLTYKSWAAKPVLSWETFPLSWMSRYKALLQPSTPYPMGKPSYTRRKPLEKSSQAPKMLTAENKKLPVTG